jgi:hypothetical protein
MCVEAIYMSITALTNSWALLNIIKPLDNNRFRLLSRAIGYMARGTFITKDSLFHLNRLLVKFDLCSIKGALTKYL